MKKKVVTCLMVALLVFAAGTAWGYTESGDNNFFGTGAGSAVTTTGVNDTFVGAAAGENNTGGFCNSFFGYQAGEDNAEGNWNSFFGYKAGYRNTNGSYNSFFGELAGSYNTTGVSNSFFGDEAGYFNTTGDDNIFLGDHAGYNNATGSYNVFLGNMAGYSETGSNKLYIDDCYSGYPCPAPLIYGEFDNRILEINGYVGVGKIPLTALDVNGTVTATGYSGDGSGLTNVNAATVTDGIYTTDSYDDPLWITGLSGSKISGAVADADSATTCTTTAQIGSNTTNGIPRWNGSQFVSGIISDDGSAATVNGTLTVTSIVSVSDRRYKKDIRPLRHALEKVTRLSGVSYEWRKKEFPGRGFGGGRQVGLIAQDVEKVLPEVVHTDSKGYKAVAYQELVPVLIEAVKEEQAEIKKKDAEIAKMKHTMDSIERQVASLESSAKIASAR